MARYSSFLGRTVEVHYRAGDILLPASGIFVADSGRSIFLEQSFIQRGQQKHFRWEIPYQFIVRLQQKSEAEQDDGSGPARTSAVSAETGNQTSRAKAAASSAPGILPLQNGPKTA